jgi:replicative DNA helicase
MTGLDNEVQLRAGGLYVLAAGPGCGKTSLALHAASATTATSRPGQVLFVSLEMKPADIAGILAGRALGIGADHIRNGTLDGGTRDQVVDLAEKWKNGELIVRDSSAGATVDGICAWSRMRRNAAGGKLALVIIDYLQLIDSPDPRATEYQRLSYATRRLKQMALEIDAPILLLSQLSRDGTKQTRDKEGKTKASPEPRLADLRGSGSIEQDADAVVALYRTGEEEGEARPMRALILKNRRGRQGAIDLLFYGKTQTFTDTYARADERMASPPSESEDAFQ